MQRKALSGRFFHHKNTDFFHSIFRISPTENTAISERISPVICYSLARDDTKRRVRTARHIATHGFPRQPSFPKSDTVVVSVLGREMTPGLAAWKAFKKKAPAPSCKPIFYRGFYNLGRFSEPSDRKSQAPQRPRDAEAYPISRAQNRPKWDMALRAAGGILRHGFSSLCLKNLTKKLGRASAPTATAPENICANGL